MDGLLMLVNPYQAPSTPPKHAPYASSTAGVSNANSADGQHADARNTIAVFLLAFVAFLVVVFAFCMLMLFVGQWLGVPPVLTA